jgi:uncharacterized membrane protein
MTKHVNADTSGWPSWLIKILVLGFALVFIGSLLVVLGAMFSSGFEGGGASVVIFIGPIPIVFGAGQNTALLILIGVIIALAMAIFSYVMYRKQRS